MVVNVDGNLGGMNPLFSSLVSHYETRLIATGIPQRLGLGAPCEPLPLYWSLAAQAGVSMDVLPLDRLHPVISGNKWFKLKYNLLAAHEQGCVRLASCGGARSNHLHALAWAGKSLGLSTWAAIRGEELSATDNATLRDVSAWGMSLQFVSRQRYREMREQGWAFFDATDTYNIPEGGDNFLGVLGCMSLAAMIDVDAYEQVHVAGGTGCTFLGLRVGLPAKVTVVGYSMLKGGWQQAAMASRLRQWSDDVPLGAWVWDVDSSRRFAQTNAALKAFMQAFSAETGLWLDPVYTGPMFMRLGQRLQRGAVAPGSRLLVVHSGGLQGNHP
jgi:1-aminocyclopropane-1-carboxylate deaminase